MCRTKRRTSQKDTLSGTLGPKSIKLRSEKSTQNHKKCGLGVAWEALGRGLGGILGPTAAQESKRETHLGSLAHLGVPKGPPLRTLLSTLFAIFGVFLSRVFEALFWRLLRWYVLMLFAVFLERPSLRRMLF